MKSQTLELSRLDERLLEQAADMLRVMAHAQRLRIVEMLMLERHSVGELALALEAAPSAVSQHLNLMKAHGLVEAEREARNVYYRVTNPNAINLIKCLRKHGQGTF